MDGAGAHPEDPRGDPALVAVGDRVEHVCCSSAHSGHGLSAWVWPSGTLPTVMPRGCGGCSDPRGRGSLPGGRFVVGFAREPPAFDRALRRRSCNGRASR